MKVLTIKLEDKGQDFVSLDIDENGVISGFSPIFSDNRITLLGIGTTDGVYYKNQDEVLKGKLKIDFKAEGHLFLYYYLTTKNAPVPWEASTFKYRITDLIYGESK